MLKWLNALERTSCTNCREHIRVGADFLIIAQGTPSKFNPKQFGEGPEVAHLCERCCNRMGIFKATPAILMPETDG